MNTFVYHNPTRLVFGKGTLERLSDLVKPYGSKILVVYGGGSIKRNGIYDNVMQQLRSIGAEIHELGGVEPNPRHTTVNKGADLCKKEGIEFILAVGGGSVIDCVKAISVGAKYDGDAWDIVTRKAEPKAAVPFGTVLTLAATGSEMNSGSVITNWDTQEKYGWGSNLTYPQFSILDPESTSSVPKDHTIYGIADIMSHLFEHYFNHTANAPIQSAFVESLLRIVIDAAPKLIADLHSYQQRETILYSGTMALNGMLSMGTVGDWASHNIEHAVSAVYDIPHGGGLAILFPNWMGHVLDAGVPRFKQFAVNVFGVDPAGKSDRETALEGIQALRAFWNSIGAPSRLADYGIGDDKLDIMVDKAMINGPFGNFMKLDREDVRAIYVSSL
ncbi:iron-containing alcohol dehydrogenase [Paenibacillus sepulcri]|uniref:Iron-containing alcohol dehydrogenase n=1 Tax=Paenibacillus sepulcri TaxID=359917 RepID=A0ABS7C7R3_9BACL|nr:iron-containing alcohol dehydrogenase [Paenibacillus sepulcri]